MDKTVFALSLGFGGVILATGAADAAACAPRDQVVARLATGFDEVRRAAGLAAGPNGQARIVEVFASEAGSWTLLVTLPDGTSCIAASGEAWQDMAARRPASGSPA